LCFGHLDRYFEYIDDLEPSGSKWTEVNDLIATEHAFSKLGFAAHTKHLQAVETLGLFEVWGILRPPDYCVKRDSGWACQSRSPQNLTSSRE